MSEPIKYTILPWMNAISAGRILPAAIGILIAYHIFEYFFKKYNNTVRRGTMALIGNTVWALILNLCIFTVAFWKWAFPLAAGMGILFVFIIRNELERANQEEREGFRGLNPEIRSVRAEMFAALSIEEQMEYKKNVKPQRFWWWIWLPAVVLIPFLAVLLLEQLGAGDYLFHVVYY